MSTSFGTPPKHLRQVSMGWDLRLCDMKKCRITPTVETHPPDTGNFSLDKMKMTFVCVVSCQ